MPTRTDRSKRIIKGSKTRKRNDTNRATSLVENEPKMVACGLELDEEPGAQDFWPHTWVVRGHGEN